MKHLSFAAALAVALLCAAPAAAGPLNEAGVTREQMIGIMTRGSSAARCARYPSVASEMLVEARELTHKLVEASARRRQFA